MYCSLGPDFPAVFYTNLVRTPSKRASCKCCPFWVPVGLGAVWANRAFFSGLRVVLALELSTYFTIFPVRALQVWVTLCSSWNLHTDCKESIGRFICPFVAGGMSWPLLQISITWFPYFFAGLHVSWAPYT